MNISLTFYLKANEYVTFDNPVAPTDGYFLLNQMYQGSGANVTISVTSISSREVSGKDNDITIHLSYLMYKSK